MRLTTLVMLSSGLVAGLAATANAQHTVLFNLDSDQVTLDNGNGHPEVGRAGEAEIMQVTPAPGAYSARPFLPLSSQWAYLGDEDADGRYADASTGAPGGDIDAVFVRNAFPLENPVKPRDVFMSRESDTDMAAGFMDGDVYRFGTNGNLEFFLTEAQLQTAMGTTSSSVDLNALCQTALGDLYFSISLDVTPFTDDGLIHIPANAIMYDAAGMVSSIAASSAVQVAGKSDFDGLIANSGFATSTGGAVGTGFSDLSALEIDPAGGTWTALSSGATIPHLFFAWQGFSNDGAIISTQNGGELAMVNGVPMGSTLATQGTHIGILPESTGIFGLEGLALIPQQEPFPALENYPQNLHTSTGTDFSWHQIEIASATPNSFVQLFVALGPSAPGGFVASAAYPFGTMEFFTGIQFFSFATVPTDALGYGAISFLIPPNVNLPNVNVVFQAIDGTTLEASIPAALQFI